MCGPHVHYTVERWEDHGVQNGRRARSCWSIRAGVNIVTGEPETNDGTELTADEKDTLRWHFCVEYPTWRDLWEKHIKPHFGRLDDCEEWVDALRALLTLPGCISVDESFQLQHGAWGNAREIIETHLADGDDPDAQRFNHLGRRHHLASFLRAWRHRRNRQGYWANPIEKAQEPEKKADFRHDVKKNSHAELMEAKT